VDDPVRVQFPLTSDEDGWPPVSAEWLAATKAGDDAYAIDSIPIFATGIALGDVVDVEPDDQGQLIVGHIARRSGNSTYRVAPLAEAIEPNPALAPFVRRLADIGCSTAGYENMMLAVNVPQGKVPAAYAIFEEGVAAGVWDFEEGFCFSVEA